MCHILGELAAGGAGNVGVTGAFLWRSSGMSFYLVLGGKMRQVVK